MASSHADEAEGLSPAAWLEDEEIFNFMGSVIAKYARNGGSMLRDVFAGE